MCKAKCPGLKNWWIALEECVVNEWSNKTPLAQQAKRALIALKTSLEPGSPYPLQLIRKGLEDRELCPVSRQDRADLLDALDHLDGMPERALELIIRGTEPTEDEEFVPIDPNLTPEELILELVFRLKISLNALDALPKRSAN